MACPIRLRQNAGSFSAQVTIWRGQVPWKEPTGSGRRGDSEAILSLTEAMYAECAVDADALGFMAKMLVQTTLPHRAQPGKQYTRTDGDVALSITDLGGAGLPYGAYPRLILVWMTTEALRTGERKLELGRSRSSFMGQLGLPPSTLEACIKKLKIRKNRFKLG